jgi:hypothetical protein
MHAHKLELMGDSHAVSNPSHATTEKEKNEFVEDDRQSRGAVQRDLLRRYAQTSGGWRSWSVVAGCYIAYNGLLLALVCISVRLLFSHFHHNIPTNPGISTTGFASGQQVDPQRRQILRR